MIYISITNFVLISKLEKIIVWLKRVVCKITNTMKPPLIQTWKAFNMFLVPCVRSIRRKWIVTFLSFPSKCIDMHRIDTMLSLILLVSEMLKIPRVKVDVHFLKKLAFVTNKCLAHNAFRKFPMATENLSKYIAVRE